MPKSMHPFNAFLLGATLAFCIIIAGRTYATAATQSHNRYTQSSLLKIHSHRCTEDEYMFIPARYVNPNVIYNTPNRALCVAIENTRPAPVK